MKELHRSPKIPNTTRGKMSLKNRNIYWSDDHRYFLYYCATQALKTLDGQRSNGIEIDDLVSYGWLRHLRLIEKETLKKYSRRLRRQVIWSMLHYVFVLWTKKKEYELEGNYPGVNGYSVDKIDFQDFIGTLPKKSRIWVKMILRGSNYQEVANYFGVSRETVRRGVVSSFLPFREIFLEK